VTAPIDALEERPYVPMAEPVITHHIASVVLGYLREGGWPPSTGEERLIDAAFNLDPDTATACLSCPGLLEAVRVYRNEGAAALQAIKDAA
jgi:hypothetical protein